MANEEQISLFPIGVKMRVAPDQEFAPWPSHLPVPRVGMMEWVPQADGSYRPMIHCHPVWVRMTEHITEDLGLGINYQALRRLMRAGFVRERRIAPGQYSFDLQSYFKHCAAVQADPYFWENERNLKRYMEAL